MKSRSIAVASSFVFALGISLLPGSPAVAEEAGAENQRATNILEQEILITEDHEILEVGPGKDVESVRAYQAEFAEERGDDMRAYSVGYGYLSNGTLTVDGIGCSTASVEYYKTGGKTIRARFGLNQGNESTQWASGKQTVYVNSRRGNSFKLRNDWGDVWGAMNVGGIVYETEKVSCE